MVCGRKCPSDNLGSWLSALGLPRVIGDRREVFHSLSPRAGTVSRRETADHLACLFFTTKAQRWVGPVGASWYLPAEQISNIQQIKNSFFLCKMGITILTSEMLLPAKFPWPLSYQLPLFIYLNLATHVDLFLSADNRDLILIFPGVRAKPN